MSSSTFEDVLASVVGFPPSLLQVLAALAGKLTPEQREAIAHRLQVSQKAQVKMYEQMVSDLKPAVAKAQRTKRQRDEAASKAEDEAAMPTFD